MMMTFEKFLFESKGKESGELTRHCLKEIFCGFAAITKRTLEDHLKGGVLDTKDDELRQQSKSVQKSNVLSERDFGMLDHLMKMKPKATDMAMEGLIMFKVNVQCSGCSHQQERPVTAKSSVHLSSSLVLQEQTLIQSTDIGMSLDIPQQYVRSVQSGEFFFSLTHFCHTAYTK